MSIVKPAAILLIICAIVSGILGYVNDVTTAPIAAADKKTTEESMNAFVSFTIVIPSAVNVTASRITGIISYLIFQYILR